MPHVVIHGMFVSETNKICKRDFGQSWNERPADGHNFDSCGWCYTMSQDFVERASFFPVRMAGNRRAPRTQKFDCLDVKTVRRGFEGR
jgi:hypothetical protein